MKRRYRERIERWVRRSESGTALTLASVAESTVVPIPIEVIITPMMIHAPQRKWIIAAWTLLGSVIGTSLMYLVGAFLFEAVGRSLVGAMGADAAFEEVLRRFRENGVLTVAFVSATPIPLVIAALGAGAAKMSFPVFLAVVAATRALRYFGLALLVQLFGARVRDGVHYLSEHPTARWVSLGLTVVLGAGLFLFTR